MHPTADRPPILLFLAWFSGLLAVTLGLVLLSSTFDAPAAQGPGLTEAEEVVVAGPRPATSSNDSSNDRPNDRPNDSAADAGSGSAAHQGQR